jgi:glycosyltransferase involved in cell wall biosynthesis
MNSTDDLQIGMAWCALVVNASPLAETCYRRPVTRALIFGEVPHRVAGAQKSLLVSLSGLQQHGVTPIVVFPHRGPVEAACRQAGIEVRLLESPPAFQSFGGALSRLSLREKLAVGARQLFPFGRALARLAEEIDASVIHFNTPRGLVMAGFAGVLGGVPVSAHLRGVPAIPHWRLAQAIADGFVLVAHALLPHVAPAVRAHCRVVYNGVQLRAVLRKSEARASVEEKLRAKQVALPASAKVIVSVSSPTPFKGLHHLLEAARRLVERGGDVIFLCAGAGTGSEYESWLQRRIESSGIAERFRLLGFWEDVHELLSSGDVTVLSSVQEETLEIEGRSHRVQGTEGLPRAVLESFAAARPVVASDIAGVREQIEDGRTGVVVPPGDPAALADALSSVLGRPEWLVAAGQEGREVVSSKFSVEAAARGLASFLTDLARNPPSNVERAGRLVSLARSQRLHG